jgi:soluble lytic murein transglycosylase-like protein
MVYTHARQHRLSAETSSRVTPVKSSSQPVTSPVPSTPTAQSTPAEAVLAPREVAQLASKSGKAMVHAPLVAAAATTPEASPVAEELYQAMKKAGVKANDSQRREIARELAAASAAFKVDPKLMLALFKHESAGIDPRARSFTGAVGLGQLTNSAIFEMIRVSKAGQKPFNQHLSVFKATDRNPWNIRNNIWTSTAYLALMKQRFGNNTTLMLKRYGDPYVPTYAQKVYAEYRNLFGKAFR